MTRKFVVIFESPADYVTASELADRVLQDAIAWLTPELLPFQRAWLSEAPPGTLLTWKSLPGIARAAGIRVHGHFNGEPGLADASAARRAIAYLRQHLPDAAAIVLVRDADDQLERRQGLEQARQSCQTGWTIILGLAIPMRECWVICGFEPQDSAEQDRLETESAALGRDPRTASHELTARNELALRSPKRVLGELTNRNPERARDCWQQTPLETLAERGRDNGLAGFLAEVRERLVPLIRRAAAH